MEGTWNHDAPHYRCRYPSEYALANAIVHPRTIYLREAAILPSLDHWLEQLFDHQHLDATCQTLAAATEPSTTTTAAADAARRTLHDCDRRLVRYRAALDAGADPTLVTAWIAETQAERASAEQAHAATRSAPTMTTAEVRTLIEGLPKIVQVLADAPPHDKAKLYEAFGLELTYHPERRTVTVSADPTRQAGVRKVCRRGDLNPHAL
jgi:site-specific DNA recombinase